MTKPDWTTAPEDAQFYSCSAFRKHENGVEYKWRGGWMACSIDPIEWHRGRTDFEMRPTTSDRNHPAAACQYNDNLAPPVEWPASESRIDAIGQNGGDGDHYSSEPEWIEWDVDCFDGCPVPDGHDVEVRFLNGEAERNNEPEEWNWYNMYGYEADDDIVAYRDWTVFHEQQQMAGHSTMKQKDVSETLGEREQTYGEFADLAEAVENMRNELAILPSWHESTPAHREAAHMILQKLARAFNGDPHYSDSWHDIAGYAKLAEKECKQ